MASILKIEGIGPVYREKLMDYGIRTVEALLKTRRIPPQAAGISARRRAYPQD